MVVLVTLLLRLRMAAGMANASILSESSSSRWTRKTANKREEGAVRVGEGREGECRHLHTIPTRPASSLSNVLLLVDSLVVAPLLTKDMAPFASRVCVRGLCLCA